MRETWSLQRQTWLAEHRRPFAFALSLSTHRLLLLLCSSVLLAGCATDRHKSADPLLGTPPPAALGKPAPVASGPAATNPAPADKSASAVPPPVTTAPGTMAALAANSSRPPADPRSDLRIPDKPAQAPVALLRQPESVVPRTTGTPTSLPGIGTGQPAAGSLTLEQAQARLASRNIRWQRLEMTPDQREWQFSCSVPSRQNPSSSRTYEAQAATPAAAVQAVLDQLDRDQF